MDTPFGPPRYHLDLCLFKDMGLRGTVSKYTQRMSSPSIGGYTVPFVFLLSVVRSGVGKFSSKTA